MYYKKVNFSFSATHFLNNYIGPDSQVHGHNWKITVYFKGTKLDSVGMLIDSNIIEEQFKNLFGHKVLNNQLKVNPTSENLAYIIYANLNTILGNTHEKQCYRVDVEEVDGTSVVYECYLEENKSSTKKVKK